MTPEEVTAVHTHHGKRVDFNNIRPTDICLEDIAWSLAGQNRWTAHGNFPWFVTDHSLLVHERVKGDQKSTPVDHLRALTHDMPMETVGRNTTRTELKVGRMLSSWLVIHVA